MKSLDGGTTRVDLLKRVAEWGDGGAWSEFFGLYDPLVRRWCRGFGFTVDQHEELCQRIWIELATRIRVFRYDPGRTFRGWLRRLVTSRACDLLRELKGKQPLALEQLRMDQRRNLRVLPSLGEEAERDDASESQLLLLDLAERAQESVRRRVAPDSWRAFWLIAVDDWSFRETAEHLGKKYLAVFRAHQRISQMLRDEGERLLDPVGRARPAGTSPKR